MRLSELMSSMDLSIYPQIALFIFLAVFVGVTWWVFTRRGRDACREAALLPLSDGATEPAPATASTAVAVAPPASNA